ncbi:MAG: AEC family transporter [Alphaproteobacteria bacterium]|nr:AEC family transporter [Alphaproteobacteria bacterium]
MIGQLFAIVAPVMIAVAVGYVMARLGKKEEPEYVTLLVTYVGTPCLVFSTLANIHLDLSAVGQIAGAAALTLVLAAAVGYPLLRLTRLSVRGYLPSLMHPNTGNMGLPLCLFAFGEEGLALGIAFYVVIASNHFVTTPVVASGSFSLRRIARSPIIYAVVIAFGFLVTRTAVPDWINNATRLLGGITIPLLLITLGFSLARLKVGNLRTSLFLALARLCIGFAAGHAVAEILGLEGVARSVAILQASMPNAVFNYLFAKQYDAEPDGVAGMVVVSTLLSFAALPLLLWYLL